MGGDKSDDHKDDDDHDDHYDDHNDHDDHDDHEDDHGDHDSEDDHDDHDDDHDDHDDSEDDHDDHGFPSVFYPRYKPRHRGRRKGRFYRPRQLLVGRQAGSRGHVFLGRPVGGPMMERPFISHGPLERPHGLVYEHHIGYPPVRVAPRLHHVAPRIGHRTPGFHW